MYPNALPYRFVATVLSTLPVQEEYHIATLFSPEGMLKIGAPPRHAALLLSLTEGEFICTLGRGTLYRLREGTILNQHLRLRERLENVETAGQLAQALLQSQWPGKAAPALYQLFSHFLKLIPDLTTPHLLATLFQIKIWKYEGLLQQTALCSLCSQPPEWRFGGERFCEKHAPIAALQLDPSEESELLFLSEERSLHKLLTQPMHIQEKISVLFKQTFA